MKGASKFWTWPISLAIFWGMGILSCTPHSQFSYPKAMPAPGSVDTLTLAQRLEVDEPRYSRKTWMPQWADQDGDCQNTRHEILASTSEAPVERSNDGCKVDRGAWTCPYTGILFKDPRKVDIDHVVPLKEAHESGGWEWSQELRDHFANGADPEELIPVEKESNQRKSDKDPADWIPRKDPCGYLSRWVRIKARWDLAVDPREAQAIERGLKQCQSEGIPVPTVIFKSF